MLKKYNEEALKYDEKANLGRPYQQCAISVMDTIADPDIFFDDQGICNYYGEYKKTEAENVFTNEEGESLLLALADSIKSSGHGKQYDCILGLSGGADSTYLAWLSKQLGLRPLVVHFDYGWNLELAVSNIENIIKKLDYDLHTIVMDWEEMKSLQRSYYKSSVLDLDVPADHMIFGALYKTATQFGIKYILSGKNVVTEAVLPRAWNYNKFDLTNLKDIHKHYENTSLKNLPALGIWQVGWYHAIKRIKTVELLNYVNYNKQAVKELIKKELNWKDYGGKHYENIYTRFYQGYVLPIKFGIDKRKAHLSNLIFSGQINKEQALAELKTMPYEEKLMFKDFEYLAKKLGFTNEEFYKLIDQENRSHLEFKTDEYQKKIYYQLFKIASPLTRLMKSIRVLK